MIEFKEKCDMKEIKIKASREYNAYIDSDISNISSIFEKYNIRKTFVITDENVLRIYSGLVDNLKEKALGIFVIKPGEESKSQETMTEIYRQLINSGADRKTTVLSFGGGVVGDLSGFAASTFMRGINLVHIPTTLLAQSDSSIGGKNGYNLFNTKNIIGTFYQPLLVYIGVNFLKTLSEAEYINGIAEVIKYGIVCDSALFQYLLDNKKEILERDIDKMLYIINECVKIKGGIVEKDERDSDSRQVLNFGHTIVHGVESIINFRLTHGEAVAIGMNIEAYMAYKLGYIEKQYYHKIINLIKDFKLPLEDKEITSEGLMEFIKRDKKKEESNIKFALPYGVGNAIITADIKKDIIINAIKEIAGR
jgi:3-dehydroquinate synthase